MLRISVLGPVEVRRDDRPLTIPGGKTTELLVRLAVEAGLSVRGERLVEDLWAGGAAATSRNTLQSKVSRLRRALGDPGVIAGGEAGYRLAVDPASVDAIAVLGEAGDAARLLERGDDRGDGRRIADHELVDQVVGRLRLGHATTMRSGADSALTPD